MASAQAVHATFGRTSTAMVPVAFRARDPRTWPAGIPQAFEQCDGTWLAPFWDPEARAWRLQEIGEMDHTRRIRSRAECGNPECDGLHTDEYRTREERRRLASVQAQPQRTK